MNPDLPQFEEGMEGWSEITLAYDLAPVIMMVPVAIQILTENHRVLATGIITSTEDVFDGDSKDNEKPITSIIYLRDAEKLSINWARTKAVLAMVALAAGEVEHGEGEG